MDEDYYRRVVGLMDEEISALREKLHRLEVEKEKLWSRRNAEIFQEFMAVLWELPRTLAQVLSYLIARYGYVRRSP